MDELSIRQEPVAYVTIGGDDQDVSWSDEILAGEQVISDASVELCSLSIRIRDDDGLAPGFRRELPPTGEGAEQ